MRSVHAALSIAVVRLLTPLVRILLRNGMSHATFAELAKKAYVDVAMREFTIPGRKQSVSRVSVITGLSRKEVARVNGLPGVEIAPADERYNRAARIISAWNREPAFLDRHGRPRPLPETGEGAPGFADLVRRFGADVPVRATLDELLRVGAVRRDGNGDIHLLTSAYVPHTGDEELIAILGADAGELIDTIDHNMTCESGDVRFQRKVSYDNIPVSALPALRALSADSGQALLETLNGRIAQHDRDVTGDPGGDGRAQVSVGIYYYEKDLSEDQTK